MIRLNDILKQILLEEKAKRDRCLRIADRKFDKPSAYKSGAVVRCRRGDIWKDLKEVGDSSAQPYSFDYYGESDWGRIYGFNTEKYPYTVEILPDDENPNRVSIRFYISNEDDPDIEDDSIVTNEGNLFRVMATVSSIIKKDLRDNPEVDTLTFAPSKKTGETTNISRLNLYLKYIKKEFPNVIITKGARPQDVNVILKEDESLHKWFNRRGAPGKNKGWVDCNTCRDGKCKPCGRKEGETRAKYPSCRPTPAGCKRKGKGKTWGKTK
jgi:hypothetical protein